LAEEKILSGATVETKEKAFKTFPLRIPLDLHKAAKEAAWKDREFLHEFILKLKFPENLSSILLRYHA